MIWRWKYLLPLLIFCGQSRAEHVSTRYEPDYAGTDGADLSRVFVKEEEDAILTDANEDGIDDATGFDEGRRFDESEKDEDSIKKPDLIAEETESEDRAFNIDESEKDEDSIKETESDGLEVKRDQKKEEGNHNAQFRLKIDTQSKDGQDVKEQRKRSDGKRSGLNEAVALNSSSPPPYVKHLRNTPARAELDDIYFLFIVIGCSVAGIAGLALAGYCWYKLHTTAKAVSEAEYSGYGTRQPSQGLKGDEKLDYNAEMYHYHQTKSQLAAMEKANGARKTKGEHLDDEDSGDEGDEGDYTVYECPGLAPTGDMTVVNPLFSDQEAIGSDQDASGHSGQGSPVVTKDTSRSQ